MARAKASRLDDVEVSADDVLGLNQMKRNVDNTKRLSQKKGHNIKKLQLLLEEQRKSKEVCLTYSDISNL